MIHSTAYPYHYDCGHYRGALNHPAQRWYTPCPRCAERHSIESKALAWEMARILIALSLITYAYACLIAHQTPLRTAAAIWPF